MQQLLAQLESKFPPNSLQLNPPISLKAEKEYITSVSESTGFKVPNEVLETLRWRNGQSLGGKSLFPCYRHFVDAKRMKSMQLDGVSFLFNQKMNEAQRKLTESIHDKRYAKIAIGIKAGFP